MNGKASDLTLDETRSVIASILGESAIEDWLIIAKKPCIRCGRAFCGDGDLVTASSRGAQNPDGSIYHEPAFELHLIAKFADSLAEQWAGIDR